MEEYIKTYELGIALRKEDSPENATERFYYTLRRMLSTIIDINATIQDQSMRLKSEYITIAGTLISNMSPQNFSPIVDTFCRKSIGLSNEIFKRDLPTFKKSARDIFKGVPEPVISSFEVIMDNDIITTAQIDCIFDIIHSLFRMSVKRNLMIISENDLDVFKTIISQDADEILYIKNLTTAIEVFGIKASK